jgi:hypothetical protein
VLLLCLSTRKFCAVWHTKLAIHLADNITFQVTRDLALALLGFEINVSLLGVARGRRPDLATLDLLD